MAKVSDVYRDWLGIQDKSRPLNHYQLLRLNKFEDTVPTIRSHYRKMVSHVRRYSVSDSTGRCEALQNELATAMLCLTDAKRKQEYDAMLGRKEDASVGRRTFEDILLANKVVDQTQLAKASKYAKAVGLDIRDAVLQQKLAPPDVVMLSYAEAVGLPYVDLDDIGVAQDLVPLIPPPTARQHSCVPVMADQTQVIMASPNPLAPDVEEELRLRLGKQIRTVLCTAGAINAAVARYYPPDAVAAAAGAPAKTAAATPEQKAVRKRMSVLEKQRQRLMIGIVSFNLSVVATMVALFYYRGGRLDRLGWMDVAMAAGIGLIGAVMGFSIAPKFQR
jgi:hypothetical protein